ncbi:MAG: leucyl/phenylalanyl-tRNA--protein transferase [Granulosicoccus sp.]|nr:leucyl/phenylalanyl-tRNA--protein transferase [Granulosicoccus sp.]
MPIPFLAPDDDVTPFPSVRTALSEPNGLLMAGGNLNPERLLSAYKAGIFPWYESEEPILWWSPDPRCIIWPEELRITRSLRKTINGAHFEITENKAYRDVMRQCAAPRKGSSGTWVTDEMIDAYCELNSMGVARSVEVWLAEQLVGGLYGIQLGRVFVGESMFSRERDASKVALAHLAQCGRYSLIDCQLETPHLVSMGATTIRREHYIHLLQEYGKSADEHIRYAPVSQL